MSAVAKAMADGCPDDLLNSFAVAACSVTGFVVWLMDGIRRSPPLLIGCIIISRNLVNCKECPPSLKLWRAKVELEGVEPSSREGNLRVFYMLSLSLVVGLGQVRDNRILTLVAKVSH